jgi:uncharacterized glyoxalase superfamily protein PhnB
MTMQAPKIPPPPNDYHTITTVFCVQGADKFIAFCKQALGAEERMRRPGPNNSVMHADLKLGDTIFWVTDSINDPPTQAATVFFVNDCDTVFAKAISLGARAVFQPTDTAWGRRWARIEDRWGNFWTFTTPIGGEPRPPTKQ